jgi:hypothetical protein
VKFFQRLKVNIALVLPLIALLLTFVFFTAYGGSGQKEERELTKINGKNEPVKVKAIKNKRGKIELNKKFDDETDWFEGLSFSIENTSAKSIKFIEIELRFVESQGKDPLSYPLIYGAMPLEPNDASTPADPVAMIRPGEEVEVVLSDVKYSRLKTALQMENYPLSVKKIQTRIETVLFDDDTMWRVGQMMKRNPNKPNSWIPLNPSASGKSEAV